MSKLKLVLGFASVLSVGPAAAQQFPGNGTNCPEANFSTGAAFKVAPRVGSPVTIADLVDPNTKVGRSNPFVESDPVDDTGAPICSGGVAPFPNTLASVANSRRFPAGWFESDPLRREVHTEILSLTLANAIPPLATIRAGQAYYDAVVPGGIPLPQARFFRNSTGEVTSNYIGNPQNLALDFPAESFFNVFVEVEIPGMSLKLYNKTPIVVEARVDTFPPTFGLPTSTYIHDPNFGAVALVDDKGLPFGWLLSAGHGSPNPGSIALGPDACVAARGPITFCVTGSSLGWNPVIASPPPANNAVFTDGPAPSKPVTTYLASGDSPGMPPDMSNAHSLVGSGFAVGDVLNSISFGKDGTRRPGQVPCNPAAGTLYFSVTPGSRGALGSDVDLHATISVPEHAADLYITAVNSFGSYAEDTALGAKLNDNLLAIESTSLGVRPLTSDVAQDDLTALEMAAYNLSSVDHLYGTLRGPSYASDAATIYFLVPSAGPLQPGNLAVFAPAGSMGLVAADIIDALVLSDVSSACPTTPNRILDAGDEALFSLAQGSPTLWGADGAPGLAGVDDDGINGVDDLGETGLGDDLSAATIFRSTFAGSFTSFASAAALGLRVTDDVDAIDIKPADGSSNNPSNVCGCFPPDSDGDGVPDCVNVLSSFCFPGQAGTLPCPCTNPPTVIGRGCDNFGAGPVDSAELTATGAASISHDTVVLNADGENNTSTTIFLQAPGSSSTGLVFGAGIRCITGSLKRLYVGPASGGSISRPQMADPSISTRSAALGDPLAPGVSRYYMTYYRDPQASGPCSNAASTFNCSNSGKLNWLP